ncbi:MAG: hypothetical protein PHN49_04780, partial [Candidatus Omnitrophica bacterium]|nr:hypothetical protein [Candidatus Omnitrophota bacterium]
EFILNLVGAFKNYTLNLSGANVPAGFDRNHVKAINLVMDRDLAKGINRDTIYVKTAGLQYLPVINGTAIDEAVHTQIPNRPVVTAAGSNTVPGSVPGFITLTQTSTKEFQFVYDIKSSATSFVFSTINVNDGMLPQDFIFGVKGPNGAQIKVEVVDASGKKAEFALNLVGDFKNYTLSLAVNNVPTGFDRNHIKAINLVMDRNMAKGINRDTIYVKTLGLDFTPILNGNAFNETAISQLPNQPTVTAAGANTVANGVPGFITMTQTSDKEFEYVYDLKGSKTAFVFSSVNLNGASLSDNLVLAAWGRENSKVKVEIKDTNGVQMNYLLNVQPAYQNYTIPLTGADIPAGFDKSSIKTIVFVMDRSTVGSSYQGKVKIMLQGLNYVPPAVLPADLLATKNMLIQKGVSYFQTSTVLDPTTHFPYDSVSVDGTVEASAKFTQPTLIGFYLQMLSEAVKGKVNMNNMTSDQLLTEIDFVVDKLLQAQTDLGWNGLIPFMYLDTYRGIDEIGLGDNANLAQSLATTIGALEGAGLSGTQQTTAQTITTKIDQFLANQQIGYELFVDSDFGIFRNSYKPSEGKFYAYIDRTAQEFRGAIAFLKTLYPTLPTSVWDNLVTAKKDYTATSGEVVSNLVAFDGAAFQNFWPVLRNNELDFVGFRNALYNQFVTQTDFAANFRIPGFLSSAEIPEDHVYVGDLGIRDAAEFQLQDLTMDVGSTYALASAYIVDPENTLKWLKAIGTLPGVNGIYGYLDSARSSTEVAKRFLGIDVASTVLGLVGDGPKCFETYLRNRGMELAYNLFYDRKDVLEIRKTKAAIPAPPEFPDRSYSVFRNIESVGAINSFPIDTDAATGASFVYGALTGGFGGEVFNLKQVYDATANQLVLQYSVEDTPKELKFEFKDASDQLLYTVTKTLVSSNKTQKLVIDLPNEARMANVKKVILVIDQNATGDTSGVFMIHSMNFQHLASSQNLQPNGSLGQGDVTVLSGNPPAQLASSSLDSTLERISSSLSRLNFDVRNNGFAAMTVNFDPTGTTTGANLSGLSKLIFGVKSNKAKTVKVEIDDADGKRAVYYVTQVSSTQKYYELQMALAAQSVDLTKVKRINFVVDINSINPGDEVDSLELEIGGLQFP